MAELLVLPDSCACAHVAADVVAGAVAGGLRVLGVATGRTPVPVYAELRRRNVRLTGVDVVLLDEYVGLDREDTRRFRNAILAQLGPLGVDPDCLHGPDVDAANLDEAAATYEGILADLGGVDLQILGLGRNGHVGFNEPGSSFTSRTRLVKLADDTRSANAPAFAPDPTPAAAVTQGLGTIADARRLLLVATGQHKAAALAAALEGPITEDIPASGLRRHPHLTVVVDRAAAAQLAEATSMKGEGEQ